MVLVGSLKKIQKLFAPEERVWEHNKFELECGYILCTNVTVCPLVHMLHMSI
jgi:hypothetical protein